VSRELLVGLDIGSSNIRVIAATLLEDFQLEIIGYSQLKSKGIKKGSLINFEAAYSSVDEAIAEAEKMAGTEFESAFVSISGAHIYSLNSSGRVTITNPRKEITVDDISAVINASKTVQLPHGKEILHVIPSQFIVDNNEGIKDPHGMVGETLEVEVHIIAADSMALQNFRRVVERAQLGIEEFILESVASAEAVLTEDEKNLGVLFINFGGGTTDISVYQNGVPVYSSVLPIGGEHVTNDIAICLKISTSEAEKLKFEYGYACSDFIERDEKIEIQEMVISRRELCKIIEVRVEELFTLIFSQIEKYFPSLSSIVITGDSANLNGLVDLLKKMLGEKMLPVKIGKPRFDGEVQIIGFQEKLMTPGFSTAIGLLLIGVINRMAQSELEKGSIVKKIIDSLKSIIGK